MTILNPSINIFNGGEITPYLHSRSDFKKYLSSAEYLENILPLIYGSMTKRSGTRYVALAKYANKEARFEDFIFSETQAYILEIGDKYIRFYNNIGQLALASADAAAWVTGTLYAQDDYVLESGIIYFCISLHTSGTFATDLTTGKWIAQDTLEVTTPYVEADLFTLCLEQNNDIVYITHKNYPPKKLSRHGSLDWTLTDIDFKDGPYQPENLISTNLMAASATTGSVTITASGTGHTPFTTNCVGQHIWLKHTGTPDVIGWGKITARTSSTVVTVQVEKAFGGTGTTSSFRLGHWTQDRGYPYVNAFHSGRHYFGGSDASPSRIDGSTPDDYETFSPVDLESGNVTDASAIVASIASGKSNAIQWLLSADTLFVGTVGAEHAFVAEGGDTALTPTNYVIKGISQHGSINKKPLKLDNNGLFIQRAGRKIREISYSFTEDKYVVPNLATFAEHLTLGGIKQIAYQEEPNSTFWLTRNDGQLLSITYDKRQDVIAWGRQNLGGCYAKIISVAAIPHALENRDQVWLLVERYINGNIVKYVEYVEKEFDAEVSQEDAFFLDSGYTYDMPLAIEDIIWDAVNSLTKIKITAHGLSTNDTITIRDIADFTSETSYSSINKQILNITKVDNNYFTVDFDTSFYIPYKIFQGGTVRKYINSISTGLDHLEGELVDIVVDGGTEAPQIVSSGTINLTSPGATIHIGLNYRGYYKSLKLDFDKNLLSNNAAISKKQKIHALYIEVYRTNYLKVGSAIDGAVLLDEIPTRSLEDLMDLPPTLNTEIKKVPYNSRWDNKPQIILMSDQPVPMTILSITPTTSVN